MSRAILQRRHPRLGIVVTQRVRHPVLVVSLLEVLPCVGPATLLPRLGSMHGHGGIGQQVPQLKGLHQIRVPDKGLVSDLQTAAEA